MTSTVTEEMALLLNDLKVARVAHPVGTLLLHVKSGRRYVVSGHHIDEDTLRVRVRYVEDKPNYAIEWSRFMWEFPEIVDYPDKGTRGPRFRIIHDDQ